jgi:hypothetical protein
MWYIRELLGFKGHKDLNYCMAIVIEACATFVKVIVLWNVK